MGLLTTPTGRRMMDGTARILLAEGLFPLTALVTTGFLTRQLGPGGYGLLALTLTTIIWIESAITSFFSKATVKFVGESDDWKPLASRIIRLSILVGCAGMLTLWATAGLISALFNEPDLAFYLRLGAIDIPILCAGQAYRAVLIGTAQFHGSAVGRAGRWLARLCLVVLLVEIGLSIAGALLGVIGSSLVELAISRRYLGRGILSSQRQAAMPIRLYGTMLFISSLCLIAYNGMDLFMLKLLGATVDRAGIYGAAQSLSLLPGLFGWTFSSLLLTTLSRLVSDEVEDGARALARDAMRVTLWLLPVAAIISGAAPELVQVVFGFAFADAAPLLSLLIIGAVANVMLIVSLTVMTAAGLPARTVMFTAPLVPLAFAGHYMLIPQFGAQGAAFVTIGVSLLGASAAVANIRTLWKISPPVGTLLRSLVIALLVGTASQLWPISGWFVFVKLMVLGMASLVGYWSMGEFRQGEIAVVRSHLIRKTESPARRSASC